MYRITLFALLFISLSACTKFVGIIDENELFPRLSRGEGTWDIVKIETWDATQTSPTISESTPTNTFYHFYIKTEYINGTDVQVDVVDYFEGESLDFHSTISAQEERVVFEGSLGGGTVWTVIENKRKKQVWLHIAGGQATQITLEKEDRTIPHPNLAESEG